MNVLIDHSNTRLAGYTEYEITVLGVVDLSFGFRGQQYRSEFYVTTTKNHSLIGLPTLKQNGLVDVCAGARSQRQSVVGDLQLFFNDLRSLIQSITSH